MIETKTIFVFFYDFLKTTWLQVALSVFLKAISLLVGAFAIGIIINLITSTTTLYVPLLGNFSIDIKASLPLAVGFFLLSSFCIFLSNLLAIYSAFYYEKKCYSSSIAKNLNVAEFRGIQRVQVSLVGAVTPVILLVSVSLCWIWLFPVTLLFISGLVIVAILSLKYFLSILHRSYQRSLNDMRNELSESHNVLALMSPVKRPFFKILLVPQVIILLFQVFLIVIVALFLVYGEQIMAEVLDSSYGFLPLITIVSLLQISSLANLFIKLGVFSGLINKLINHSACEDEFGALESDDL